ncbi:serine-threonine protein kinase, plant-type, putative [Ricinus communis]|uniref:non-specific serine/threonine protein kinase n=1 Tax=Ricinus communis TaxID=3988 RepID=B9SM56_RICCO|nr:serine-threonine protein kinase, plant-type, putative [Ricinus communis]
MRKSWACDLAFLLLTRWLQFSLAIPKSNLTDLSALLVLKEHSNFDPFMSKNWSSATSFCHWYGVTCSERHNRVVALTLSNMGIKGIVPPHIGNLSFLVHIDMSNNSYSGHLPNELGNLHRLKFMNFSNNSFVGEIPSSLAMLPKLQHLLLANNSLTAGRSSIFNITTLNTLDLNDNLLGGNILDNIGGNLSNLQVLNMGLNQLSGSFPPKILDLPSLKFIYLQVNNLSGNLKEILCNQNSKLQLLNLAGNQLYGQIPSDLYKCKELRSLALHANKFTGSIPRTIGNLTKLKWLSLGRNNLTGRIPLEIGNLQNLQIVHLSFNNLNGSIPHALFNISTMKWIAMTSNNLLGNLPTSLGLHLPNLIWLYLGINKLSGPIPSYISNASKLTILELPSNSFTGFIPDSLGDLRNLQTLKLGANLLSSKKTSQELTIFSSLKNCQNLKYLWLSYNPLDGYLPHSVGNLSNSLESFLASDGLIKGSVHESIGNLSSLTRLNLGNNDLTGRIPTTIGTLKHLQGLYLHGNDLDGSIPSELCDLRTLYNLELTGNKLSGSIPTCFSNLTSLRNLFLASNRFVSTISSTLWTLKDILQVNLASNYLTGSLPSEIENLRAVYMINISKNQLSGEIPISIGGLQDLAQLYLSGNKLQGPIPQSVGDIKSLEFLDLSSNNLSGMIPKSLDNLLYLKYFNVSFNYLQGEIPEGGSFSNFSAQSFIGNEALCGSARLQVSPCKDDNSRATETPGSKIVLRYVLPAIVFAVFVLAFVIMLKRYCERKAKFSIEDDFLALTTIRRISYHELQLATNGFQESNFLGMGSFGSVYKGTLSDGTVIAAKVFNLQLERAFKSFDTECEVLRNLRHRNLVKIITSCSGPNFKALVLEFMPNWSLEKWLYSDDYFLNNLQRLNIMLDVASVLEYLHHGYTIPMAHCDIKPSNVLLNEDMVAFLADFGISKLLGEEGSVMQTMTLATIGYMAPEYGSEGIVSVRGDVYSYGVLLMETFTQKKPTDKMFTEQLSLKSWVEQSLSCEVTQVIDANLLGIEEDHLAAKKDCIVSILKLALQCSADLPHDRIDMKHVVTTLQKIKTKFLRDIRQLS